MNFETIIEAKIPRSNCPDCGVKTVSVPWAEKNARFTLMFEAFAISVLQAARSLEAGRKLLRISWDSAHAIMKRAVERGLERRDLAKVRRVGIDEKSFLRGHSYVSLLNDLDGGRVLDLVEERTEEACRELIHKALPTLWDRYKVDAAAMDMWPAYTKSAADLLESADIVFDRFHISKHLNEAVDQVRRAEHKQLLKKGDTSLKGTRYSLLRSAGTREQKHEETIERLSRRKLKTARGRSRKASMTFGSLSTVLARRSSLRIGIIGR